MISFKVIFIGVCILKDRIIGILIVIASIIFTISFEGGSIKSILCISSLILVLGGIIGGTIISFSVKETFDAFKYLFLLKNSLTEDERQQNIMIFECAGKYAIAFGIFGFILGLIYVLSDVTSLSLLGKHIAITLTSVLYGLGFAYIIFFPISTKLKQK